MGADTEVAGLSPINKSKVKIINYLVDKINERPEKIVNKELAGMVAKYKEGLKIKSKKEVEEVMGVQPISEIKTLIDRVKSEQELNIGKEILKDMEILDERAKNYHQAQEQFEKDGLFETDEKAKLELLRYINEISAQTGKEINDGWENYVGNAKLKNELTKGSIKNYLKQSKRKFYLKDQDNLTLLDEMRKIYFQKQVDIFENKMVNECSQPSEKHRGLNQDAYILMPNCAAVFDGMGGLEGGREASNTAKDYVQEIVKKFPKTISDEGAIDFIKNVMAVANEEVKIGKTTASIALFYVNEEKKLKMVIGHVGDSRIDVINKNGLFKKTIEHRKYIPKYLQDKYDNPDPNQPLDIPEKLNFKYRGALEKYLGKLTKEAEDEEKGKDRSPFITVVELDKNDLVLLMTDGVPDNLINPEIQEIVLTSKRPARDLVKAAVKRGQEGLDRSKPDDMTTVIFRVSSFFDKLPKGKSNWWHKLTKFLRS